MRTLNVKLHLSVSSPVYLRRQAARDYGLIGEISEPAQISSCFDLFRMELVDWSALPPLLPVWVGMVFVVVFSSSLDVAAIEIGEKNYVAP